MQPTAQTYRVVQWATGNVGVHAMKAVIEHPRMSLVGVWVHSDTKAGRDAGTLCGLGREIGVKATRDIADIVALRPDCVVYMPQRIDVDDICRLLEAGINIVTSVVEFHHPGSLDPAIRARIEDACRRGNSSLHSNGSSPGFVFEALPQALCMLERRLDLLTIDQFVDMSFRDSKQMIFEFLGWGKKPAEFTERRRQHVNDSFGEGLRALAESLSMPLDRVDYGREYATARKRAEIAAGVLEAGTVAASRVVVTGYRGDRAAMIFRTNFYGTRDLDPDWNVGPTGWRVQVQGDAPLDINITFPVPRDDFRVVSSRYTLNPVINAIPAVCAAEPGIRTAADLKILSVLG